MPNITAPFIGTFVLYYIIIYIADILMKVNKYGGIDPPVPLWVWIIGFIVYVMIEGGIQTYLASIKNE